MVDQHGQAVPGRSKELRQQDIAGLKAWRADRAGLRAHQSESGSPVQQRAVYPPRIRRVEMHYLIIQLAQRSLGHQLPENEAVLHFSHAHNIRNAGPENRFRYRLAFPIEARLRPPSLPHCREFTVRLPCPVILEIKEILKVPEHHGHPFTVRCRVFSSHPAG